MADRAAHDMGDETEKVARNVEVVLMSNGGFAVYVDDCFGGMCRTRAKAELAAQMERDAPEMVEEKALRLLRQNKAFNESDYSYVGLVHTGGGICLAEVRLGEGIGSRYVWISEAEGYVDDPQAEFLVGAYLEKDGEQEWIEDFEGVCDAAALLATVLAGLAAVSRREI